MIYSKEQYNRTKEWIEKFQAEYDLLKDNPVNVDPIVHKACQDATQSKINELKKEITDFDKRTKFSIP